MKRFYPTTPTPEEAASLQRFRELWTDVDALIRTRTLPNRYQALALTTLEELAMWVSKAITHSTAV